MAHRAVVLTHNDLARLAKLRDSLNDFVAKLSGEPPARKPLVKSRKPTGAAAHKRYLAKKAAPQVAPAPTPQAEPAA